MSEPQGEAGQVAADLSGWQGGSMQSVREGESDVRTAGCQSSRKKGPRQQCVLTVWPGHHCTCWSPEELLRLLLRAKASCRAARAAAACTPLASEAAGRAAACSLA